MTSKKSPNTKSLEQQKLDAECAMARSNVMRELLGEAVGRPAFIVTKTVTTTEEYSSPLGTAIISALLADFQPADCENCDKGKIWSDFLSGAVTTALEMGGNIMAARMAAQVTEQTSQPVVKEPLKTPKSK